MIKILLTLVATALLALGSAISAAATTNTVEKHALLIGNSAYPRDPLANTVRDAQLVAASLRKLGFTITELRDLTRSDMLAAISQFADGLPTGSTAFVYYAGHGMQIGGANYLTPVDMQMTSEQTVQLKAVPLKVLLERMSTAKSAVNVVVLDACRNNPFQPRGAIRYRNFSDLGLAKVQAPRGTLVAYSTSPGQLAADGRGSNSTYSTALARTLLEPTVKLEDMFKLVSTQVRKTTLDDQIPWYESSLTDDYYFQPPAGVSVVAGKPLQVAQAPSRGDSRSRGSKAANPVPSPAEWFRLLQGQEVDYLDHEIQQRVMRVTADEIPALEHKANGGSVVHQTTLGLVYREGIDKAIDPKTGKVTRYNAHNTKALKWLRMAAEAGFPVAQVELGEMYVTGHGLDMDYVEGRRWLELANQSPYTRARLDLVDLGMREAAKEMRRFPN